MTRNKMQRATAYYVDAAMMGSDWQRRASGAAMTRAQRTRHIYRAPDRTGPRVRLADDTSSGWAWVVLAILALGLIGWMIG